MIAQKLLFLFTSLFIENFEQGETKWVTLPLADSYEYLIIEGEGAHSIREYQEEFLRQGLTLEYLEVQRELKVFENSEDLKQWIQCEIAPYLKLEDERGFAEEYFRLMVSKGWLEFGDGKIRFPRKQLRVLLHRE